MDFAGAGASQEVLLIAMVCRCRQNADVLSNYLCRGVTKEPLCGRIPCLNVTFQRGAKQRIVRSSSHSRHARRFCFGALALGDVVVGFEDQDFAIRFDGLVAALDENLAAVLGQVLHFPGPASHGVEELHKVCRFDGVDRAQQLVGVLAQRLFPREAIELFSAPVPVDNAFFRVPDKNRLKRQLNQIRLSAQGLGNFFACGDINDDAGLANDCP